MIPYSQCSHPLNRLRGSASVPEWVICQDCLTPFALELICGHDLKGSKGEATAGNTIRLVRAMHDKSQDAIPLADFIPAGRTVEDCRPGQEQAPAPKPLPEHVNPVAQNVDPATGINLGWHEDVKDPKWGRPGRNQDAR